MNENAASSSRRSFLKTTSAGLTAAALSTSTRRVMGANDRLRMGIIGVGGRGSDHYRDLMERNKQGKPVELVAVCDIYERRKERAKEITGAEVHHDYRELIAREDIDAVVIASPDHWHAIMAIDAMNAGKDVYLEKPMTLYAHEAKEVYEVSKKTKKIVQVGNTGASDDLLWQARELIDSGDIGPVIWAQDSSNRNSREGEWNWHIDEDASPKNVDWKAFLGPAPQRDWDPDRYFRFRKYWDYSGGIATDLIYHRLGSLGIALHAQFPYRVAGTGGIWAMPDREVPDTFMFNADFRSRRSINIPTSMANSVGLPMKIYCRKATITFPKTREEKREKPWITVRGEDAFLEEFRKKFGKEEIIIKEQPRDDHIDNFIKCIKTREQPHMNAERGYKTGVAISMSVQSYRENKVLFFDEKDEKVVDHPPV